MASASATPPFYLSPQQQSLLYTALHSNNPSHTANGGYIHSPNTLNPSSIQQTIGNGIEQSPFIDYEGNDFTGGDSSYDFSFQDNDAARVIGELPAASITGNSVSENNENEKRSHPDDEEDDAEGDAKRHESGDRIHKKPGRKPLTTEPTSKRKAQNRAAQRAFRERKESHLKELEDKIQALEESSQSTKTENNLLRSQLEKTTVELDLYKKKLTLLSSGDSAQSTASNGHSLGQTVVNNVHDVNFQFEFPKFGTLPGPPPQKQQKQHQQQQQRPKIGNMSTNSSGSLLQPQTRNQTPALTRSPTQDGISPMDNTSTRSMSSHYTSNLNAQSEEDLAKFSGIFNPPLTNNNLASAARGSLDSQCSTAPMSTSSPSDSASGSNKGPTSSCGTSPEPFTQSPLGFRSVDALATIGEEQPNATNAAQDFNHFANVNINDYDFLTGNDNFQFDPELFGNYREPQENIVANGGLDDPFFNDADALDFITPYNIAPSVPVDNTEKPNLVAIIDAVQNGSTETEVLTSDGQLLTCTRIWEKLQSCPKVQSGDFDLDGLCADLQKKAKCSGTGPVVEEAEFRDVVHKYFGEDDKKYLLSFDKDDRATAAAAAAAVAPPSSTTATAPTKRKTNGASRINFPRA